MEDHEKLNLAARARAYVRGWERAADEFPPNAEDAKRWVHLRGLLLGLADAIDAESPPTSAVSCQTKDCDAIMYLVEPSPLAGFSASRCGNGHLHLRDKTL